MIKVNSLAALVLVVLCAMTLAACDSGPSKTPGQHERADVCTRSNGKINRKAAMQKDCPVLSDYRLFQDSADPLEKPNGNGMPYTVTTLLFSNYASKARFLYIPPGKQATYDKYMAFSFPVGTIIAKTFYFHKDLRADNSPADLIETRLLIHRKDGWVGLPYVWNEDKSHAKLRKYGVRVKVPVTGLNGKPRTIPYDVPTIHNCATCHLGPNGNTPDHPIGLKARYLNHPYTYPDGQTENQLEHMIQAGLLKGAPEKPAEDAPKAPQAFDVYKPTSKLDFADKSDHWIDVHARTYLDANCGYCHRPQGYAYVTGMWLTDNAIDLPEPGLNHYGICKVPEAGGRGAGGLMYDVVPGEPDQSITLYRISQDLHSTSGPSIGVLMPPLSRSVVDKAGVKLIRQWIKRMSGGCSSGNKWTVPKALLPGSKAQAHSQNTADRQPAD